MDTVIAPPMRGKFYYSAKMRNWLDGKGRQRMFCIIDNAIKEYTEMIDEKDYDEPELDPLFDDIIFVGEGYFSHTVGL